MTDAGCRLELVMKMPGVQTWILATGLFVLGMFSPMASAQQEPLHGLQPVEQRVADNGPLSTSLKWVQYGLREPYSFSELYQLPVGQRNYVRRNAGLWAVFPRSLYMPSEEGVVASVPAGTMYYIGGPTEVLPKIASQQAAYVPVGQISPDRVDEQRLEAELIDLRIPPSAIQPNMNMPDVPIRSAPARTPAPTVLETRIVDPDMSARSAWRASMTSLAFIRQESYRRDCLDRIMSSVSDHVPAAEAVEETLPADQNPAAP